MNKHDRVWVGLITAGMVGCIELETAVAPDPGDEALQDDAGGGGSGAAPAIEWHTGLGTDLEEHVHEGMQTLDGGYIAVGQVAEHEASTTDILVVKADASGAQEWQAIFGTEAALDVGIAVAEADDGYIIAGGLHQGGTQLPVLIKLDPEGEVVWQQTYSGSGMGALRGLEILPDGAIIATGYTDEEVGGYLFIAEGTGLLLKTDSEGETLWRQELALGQGAKVRALDDGGFAIGTTVWTEADVENAAILRTDADGAVLWSQTYGGANNVQAFDLDLTLDGGFFLVGHTTGYGLDNWDCIAIAVDPDGEQRWASHFGQPRGFDAAHIHDECYGGRQLPSGGFVVAGGSGDEVEAYSECSEGLGCSDEWKSTVIRLDEAGEVLWHAAYGEHDAGHNAAEYIGLTDDGGFIVFNDTDSQGSPEPNNFGFMKLAAE